MKPTVIRRNPVVLALALAGTSAGQALAAVPDYVDIQLQARTNLLVNDNGYNLPPGSSFNSITAVINNDGWVAFPVQLVTLPDDPSDMAPGIWLGRDGKGGIVYRHEAPVENISDRVAIDAGARVAYITSNDFSNYRIWLYDPVEEESAPVGLPPPTPTSLANISLGDDGVVGYQVTFAGNRAFASTRAFATPPDSVTHVVDSGIDPLSPYGYLYSPAMNNQRVIAGKVNVGPSLDNKEEIRLFSADGSSVRVVADSDIDPSSPFTGFDNSVAVNDHGAVAAVVRLPGNGRAVYRFDAEGTVEIARKGDGPVTDIEFFAPAINNSGLVVFRATDANGQAIYVGDGQSLVRVAGRGDVLVTDLGPAQIGQHDSSPVFSGAPHINDNGDVVFIAALHPEENSQVEWGTGVFVARAAAGKDDTIFANGFEGDVPP